MMSALQSWNQKFSSLAVREKGLIVGAGIFLVIYLPFMLAIEPALKENTNKQKQLQRQQLEISSLNQQVTDLNQALSVNLNEKLEKEIVALEGQMAKLGSQLSDLSSGFIPPDEMNEMLTLMLSQAKKLSVLELRTLPATRVVLNKSKESSDSKKAVEQNGGDKKPTPESYSLYQHKIKIRVQGSFFALKDYLNKMESMPRQFIVTHFDYTIEEHPRGILELELMTLSTNEKILTL